MAHSSWRRQEVKRKFQEWKEGEGLFCGGLAVVGEEAVCDEESGLNLI